MLLIPLFFFAQNQYYGMCKFIFSAFLMKKSSVMSVPASIATLLLFAACTTTGGGLSEAQVREIVAEELSGESFNTKVEEGINAYVAKQEEEQRKAAEEANKPQKVEDVSIDDDPFKGSADAPVTIVEFSDYECPFCARHISEVYPQIIENYVDTGKVKYVFRDFPLSFHPNAFPAAVAANCAREQGDDATYFEYHDKLFANQQALTPENFVTYAEELDLDTEAFQTCLDSGKYDEEIEQDIADGSKYGVSGTPGFFINGWFVKGAFPYETFEQYIEQELAAS